jgi:hypothetical protein
MVMILWVDLAAGLQARRSQGELQIAYFKWLLS